MVYNLIPFRHSKTRMWIWKNLFQGRKHDDVKAKSFKKMQTISKNEGDLRKLSQRYSLLFLSCSYLVLESDHVVIRKSEVVQEKMRSYLVQIHFHHTSDSKWHMSLKRVIVQLKKLRMRMAVNEMCCSWTLSANGTTQYIIPWSRILLPWRWSRNAFIHPITNRFSSSEPTSILCLIMLEHSMKKDLWYIKMRMKCR